MTEILPQGDAGVGGSAVRPVYSERSMRCYAITDQELQHIGYANTAATVFASAGAICWTLAADLFKDLRLGDAPPEAARAAAEAVQTVSFIAGIFLFGIAIAAVLAKRSMVDLIKRESKP